MIPLDSDSKCAQNSLCTSLTAMPRSRVQTESLLGVVAASSGLYTCMGCNDNCEMAQTKVRAE